MSFSMLSVWACTEGQEFTHATETEHLIFHWNEGDIGEEGLEYGKRQGERQIRAIGELLDVKPETKVKILLRGAAEGPDGVRGYPHVDRWGRIHLFRFGPTYHGYFGAVPHEMVHTLRIHRGRNRIWFFEEGFAEFVALRAGKSMRGFPWYDAPMEVAAGQWLVRDEGIPMMLLHDQHSELSMRCKAQSYTLRSSFFDYLGRRFGNEAVIEMSRRERAGAMEDYVQILGEGFEALEKAWRKDLLARYRAASDADEQARRYREETPIQYMHVCRKGAEF
jgi:hypothetical protein